MDAFALGIALIALCIAVIGMYIAWHPSKDKPYPEGPAKTPYGMALEAMGPLSDRLFSVPNVASVEITVFKIDGETPMRIWAGKKGQKPPEQPPKES